MGTGWLTYQIFLHCLALTGIAWTLRWLSYVHAERQLRRAAFEQFENEPE